MQCLVSYILNHNAVIYSTKVWSIVEQMSEECLVHSLLFPWLPESPVIGILFQNRDINSNLIKFNIISLCFSLSI